nr:MAG: hypothetical protein [Trichoderma spirale orphan RNA]
MLNFGFSSLTPKVWETRSEKSDSLDFAALRRPFQTEEFSNNLSSILDLGEFSFIPQQENPREDPLLESYSQVSTPSAVIGRRGGRLR